MKTIRLRINDKAYEKFLSLLNKFSKEEIEIIAEDEKFLATQKYLQKELLEIEYGTANFVSEEVLEDRLNKIKTSKASEDWWTEMSKEEQEDIKIGLKQADKGELIANEKVMKRFEKMALKIVWTPKADEGLVKVLEYLGEEWTILEIKNLEQKLKKLLERITKYPESCPPTNFHKNLYKGFVDKNNYIVYRINNKKEIIEIINFRGTKQKPIY